MEEEFSRPATLNDLKKIIASLNDNAVNYVLVGGYALHAHGYVRGTEDIDFMIPSNADNGKNIIRALSILSDNAASQLPLEWFGEEQTIRLADEIVIDLIFKVCGETYESLKEHIQIMDFEGLRLPVLDYEGLIKTKRYSVRPKDQADIVVLVNALST